MTKKNICCWEVFSSCYSQVLSSFREFHVWNSLTQSYENPITKNVWNGAINLPLTKKKKKKKTQRTSNIESVSHWNVTFEYILHP